MRLTGGRNVDTVCLYYSFIETFCLHSRRERGGFEMSPDVLKKIDEFLKSTDTPAFSCIDNNPVARLAFVDSLKLRYNNPVKINQSGASLCAAAAFMYCIARERPDDYAMYVLDLAMTGRTRLGNMMVTPSPGCRKALVTSKSGRSISPVDWVALASVRDDTGSRMRSVESDYAGITRGGDLKGWFNATGWFAQVVDRSLSTSTRSLENLLEINTLPTCYVCLFIKGKVIQHGSKSAWYGADHWVVLGDGQRGVSFGQTNGLNGCRIEITKPGTAIAVKPVTSTKQGEFDNGKLSFSVYTWSEIRRIDHIYMNNLTVKKFLGYYYGYLAAQWK